VRSHYDFSKAKKNPYAKRLGAQTVAHPATHVNADTPKSLGDPAVRLARRKQLHDAHVAPLTQYVEHLHAQIGKMTAIPHFDPWDGGVDAELLFLLEAPGPKAVATGFVSRNNPDETAKNFFLLNQDACIPRKRTVLWNVVPWYIGTGSRIRPANRKDLTQGMGPLVGLLALLPKLRAVALVGRKAGTVRHAITDRYPHIRIFETPHPSPLFVNNRPENRGRLLGALQEVASFLNHSRPEQ
jgi:hypothetical protein